MLLASNNDIIDIHGNNIVEEGPFKNPLQVNVVADG